MSEVLYHYTSIEAFKSIIETRKIRATRYDQMNDDFELMLGVETILDAVKQHKVDESTREYKQFLLSGVESFKEETLEVYVLSLSATADSLDQWRAYAGEGGVAIGFGTEEVTKGFLVDITPRVGGNAIDNPIRPDPANQLMQCLYTDEDGNLNLAEVVEKRFFQPNSYPAMFGQTERLARNIFLASLSTSIYQTICSIKHGAYKSEAEWRCVNFKPDNNDYPVKLSETNRFYIEMEFDPKEFIKKVWISPHGDTAGFERAVTHLKQQEDLRFEIKKSRIPFRG